MNNYRNKLEFFKPLNQIFILVKNNYNMQITSVSKLNSFSQVALNHAKNGLKFLLRRLPLSFETLNYIDN